MNYLFRTEGTGWGEEKMLCSWGSCGKKGKRGSRAWTSWVSIRSWVFT